MDGGLTLLYRGPLSSCNYGCEYCPFAKRHETAAELSVDRSNLRRFVDWVAAQMQESESQGAVFPAAGGALSVFFTPWGEALTRRWYCEAIQRLSRLPRLRRVAVQTNLSAPLDWLREACADRVGLWCTYHPGEVSRADFLRQCGRLDELRIRYSVGIVGLREHFAEIQAIRAELPPAVYLWINAYKRQASYYTRDDEEFLVAIDPLFAINNTHHRSHGLACRTGESVISVDGNGDVRRCHFVPALIGNLFEPEFARCLQARVCPNVTCSCHIGYVHMPHLALDAVFGEGILERIPGMPSM